ncbi:MAG: DarT ssDNA thymidine ADP-ribosyltransferase family protein, partial [Endomicrobiia bacterium]|nr:DarT ssDNA thymidine ADP-ribosyltransferase family protein [Endomicrobiia bacterium]
MKFKQGFYYITHIANIPSILKNGILSHDAIEKNNIAHLTIYDKEIVNIRKSVKTPDGECLWNFANVYFQPRNAMLYRVLYFTEGININ